MMKTNSHSNPEIIGRYMELVRSEHLLDFVHLQKNMRKIKMPYWLLQDDGTLMFDIVYTDTPKDDLRKQINMGIVYIRPKDAQHQDTLKHVHALTTSVNDMKIPKALVK